MLHVPVASLTYLLTLGAQQLRAPADTDELRPLTYSRTYVLTYLRTHVLTYSRTHVLTYSRTYVLTYLLTLGAQRLRAPAHVDELRPRRPIPAELPPPRHHHHHLHLHLHLLLGQSRPISRPAVGHRPPGPGARGPGARGAGARGPGARARHEARRQRGW